MTDDRRYNIRMVLYLAFFVAFVAAIVLPPDLLCGRSRASLNKTACLSDTKQIGMAVGLYIEDNDDAFPVARVDGAPSAFGWASRLETYLKRDDTLWPQMFADPAEPDAAMSYAMNANLAALPRVSEHIDGTRSVMIFEVGGVPRQRDGDRLAVLRRAPVGDGTLRGMIDSFDLRITATTPATGRISNSDLPVSAIARHGESANYLFLDGHARALAPKEISAGASAKDSKWSYETLGGCERPDLPGIDLACAAPVGNWSGRGTFSLR